MKKYGFLATIFLSCVGGFFCFPSLTFGAPSIPQTVYDDTVFYSGDCSAWVGFAFTLYKEDGTIATSNGSGNISDYGLYNFNQDVCDEGSYNAQMLDPINGLGTNYIKIHGNYQMVWTDNPSQDCLAIDMNANEWYTLDQARLLPCYISDQSFSWLSGNAPAGGVTIFPDLSGFGGTLADAVQTTAGAGMLKISALAIAVPLTFWVIMQIVFMFPKKKVKKIKLDEF